MSLFVVEPIEAANHRKLFKLFGVDYYATTRAWLSLPLMAGVGIVVALIFAPAQQLSTQILIGIGYGLLIILASFCHGLGHIISSRMVHAPVSSILITATVTVTHYDDATAQSSRVHVGRALGGPVLSLLIGSIIFCSIWRA